MATIKRFEEMHAWQTARELSKIVYYLSNRRKFSRDTGLRDAMRGASIAVVSSIAQGFESRSVPLFIDCLSRANSATAELRAQAYIALDAEYISRDEFGELTVLAEKCSRQLRQFIQQLDHQPEHTPHSEPAVLQLAINERV